MAEHPETEHEIDWLVQGVFDPDGNGADFAYTIGLVSHDVPELHIWARPPVGPDPGADWMLSQNDRTLILNRTAQDLISGRIGPGSRWTEELDGGLTTIAYEIVGPVDPRSVDAFGVAPQAELLEVRWELRRPPEPDEPVPFADAWLTRAEELRAGIDDATPTCSELFSGVATRGVGTRPIAGTGAPEIDVLISALRRVLRDHIGVAEALIAGMRVIDRARGAGGIIEAAARAQGRRTMLASAHAAAGDDAAHLAEVYADSADDGFVDALEEHLELVLSIAYGTALVADVVDTETFAAGLGWFLALADPLTAQERFDSWAPGVDVATIHIALPELDDLVGEVLAACSVPASSGMGAPLCDDLEVAWRRLTPSLE